MPFLRKNYCKVGVSIIRSNLALAANLNSRLRIEDACTLSDSWVIMAACRLVYLDVGSNIGDSIQAFADRRPELRLAETLRVAVGSEWSPSSTCVYGFEPCTSNPRWTSKLTHLNQRLASSFANLTIYTETAAGGPEQLAQPMFLSTQGVRGIGASLASTSRSAKARPVPTIVLSNWIRDVCAPRYGWLTPVVIRFDCKTRAMQPKLLMLLLPSRTT